MTIQIQKILLPTDFSEYSKAAVTYACELAEKYGSELHLLHVLEIHPVAAPDFGMGLALPRYATESKEVAEKLLTRAVDPAWAAGKTIVHALVEGSPIVEIPKYARSRDIDLIVLSTHGRTGLAHVILGSVAESIVRTAPCPVLTVRPAGHQFVMP
jgi:nucleotide-binding universal stress UspA family protein